MEKKSIDGRSSINPVRISAVDNSDRNSIRYESRRTQVGKPRSRLSSDENTHIPRPRFRSSSVDARKSGLKPPGKNLGSQYGGATPGKSSTTPRASSARRVPSSGSSNRAISPGAEMASNICPKAPRKDVRPLTEKSFQATMLYKIDTYLRSIDRSSVLGHSGSLKPITLKMFVEVSDLLVKLLGSKQDLTVANYVEELPKCAKRLHYPGTITKSWLKTANAMHSWPQVLGWLSWLVEICEAKDMAYDHFQIENLPITELDDVENYNRLKLGFVLDGYTAWNEERLDEEAEIVDRFLKNVAEIQEIREQDIEKARMEYENVETQLKAQEKSGGELDAEIEHLDEILAPLQRDIPKQENHLKELQEQMREIISNARCSEEEYKSLLTELEEHRIKQEKLRLQISQQPMSSVEREEIIDKCNEVENESAELDTQLIELDKDLYALDMKLSNKKVHLDRAIFAYNRDVYLNLDDNEFFNLEEIVLSEKESARVTFIDDLNDHVARTNELEQKLEERIKTVDQANEAVEKQINDLLTEKVSLEEKKKTYIEKLEENKNRINDIEAAARAEETDLRAEIKKLEDGIAATIDSVPDIEATSLELEEAKEKKSAVDRRLAHLKEQAKEFFEGFFGILAERRTRLKNRLNEQRNVA